MPKNSELGKGDLPPRVRACARIGVGACTGACEDGQTFVCFFVGSACKHMFFFWGSAGLLSFGVACTVGAVFRGKGNRERGKAERGAG